VCFRGTLRVNSWERAPHPVVAGQNVKSERSVAVGLSKLNRLAGPARQAVFYNTGRSCCSRLPLVVVSTHHVLPEELAAMGFAVLKYCRLRPMLVVCVTSLADWLV
jgi:hypothetical protein